MRAALGLAAVAAGAAAWMSLDAYRTRPPGTVPGGASIAAWSNIGGCGSSGGGAAAGAGKWIGRGATGGLVDLEILGNVTLGGDYLYSAAAFNTTYHVPSLPQWTAGLSLNFKSAASETEGYKVSTDPAPAVERQSGGFGDVGLSLNYLLGEAYHHSLGLAVGVPTGQHDIKRLQQKGGLSGQDDRRWLNPFVQPGSGLYSLGVTYEYTRDRDWGLMIFGGSYTAAFAADNWSCRDAAGTVTEKVINCREQGPSALDLSGGLNHQGWDAAPKSWMDSRGAPGTGATGADVFSLYAYVGRKEEASTQSVGATLNVPLSPTYYWEYGPDPDAPVSTRIRTNDYTFKLSAGLEMTHPNFPVFISVGVPWRLTDIADRGRLTAPMNYVGTLGLRGTFF